MGFASDGKGLVCPECQKAPIEFIGETSRLPNTSSGEPKTKNAAPTGIGSGAELDHIGKLTEENDSATCDPFASSYPILALHFGVAA
ncbi:hypothetical protein [uncultured Jannaschia sp.]|uniref:hypothetical protein n=1 Tax=uncultured Jannaschia sp. TaxID=293347 RepID=UPI00263788D4|nr:hypothetical protein [uncultured Jannaschia sp.]